MDVQYVTAKILADKYDSTVQTVLKLRREGKIPFIKFGGKYLFDVRAVERTLTSISTQNLQHA